MYILYLNKISKSGLKIWWSSNTIIVTEGENISLSLSLDREPELQLIVPINIININTTGSYIASMLL